MKILLICKKAWLFFETTKTAELLIKAWLFLVEAFTNPNNYIFSGALVIAQICLKCIAQNTLAFVEEYVFSDWSYAISLTLAVFLDTFLAVYESLTSNPRTFEFRKLSKGLMDKIVIYASVIGGLNIITKAKVDDVSFTFIDFIYLVGAGVILSHEIASILIRAKKKFPHIGIILQKLNFARKKFVEETQETPVK